MRILQVTTSARRRGAEVFAYQLGRSMAERGHQLTTVALEPPDGPASLEFDQLGRGRSDPRSLLRLTRFARANDVVVAHGGSTLAPVALCASAARRPFVYRNIGDPAYWGAARGVGMRVGLPLRSAAHVVALYDGAADYMARRYRIAPGRITVAPNAVDATLFPARTEATRRASRAELGIHDERIVAGFLGNLSPEKRPEWALAVAEAIADSVCVVAGNGPMLETLEHRARTMGERRGVPACRLIGPVDDPAGFLNSLDVLLVPSATEGIPGVLLEAALVGVPTVTTDVGGVAETVSRLRSGLCVARNDLTAFTAAARSMTSGTSQLLPNRPEVEQHYGMPRVSLIWEYVLEMACSDPMGR